MIIGKILVLIALIFLPIIRKVNFYFVKCHFYYAVKLTKSSGLYIEFINKIVRVATIDSGLKKSKLKNLKSQVNFLYFIQKNFSSKN